MESDKTGSIHELAAQRQVSRLAEDRSSINGQRNDESIQINQANVAETSQSRNNDELLRQNSKIIADEIFRRNSRTTDDISRQNSRVADDSPRVIEESNVDRKVSASGGKPEVCAYTASEAPDGGYGWVIVVIGFMIHVIVDGAAFGYGVVSNYVKEYFNATESQATLVGSLQLGFYLLSCPVAGKLIERYGFRIVCFSGSILAAIGFCLSTLAPNIGVFMVTYGLIAGTGFGLMYLSSISAVTLYFDKKRVLATGVTTMGSGLGMFAFSAICGFLFEKYDWKNALLIIGGIILQGCIFGMLMRPLSKTKKAVASTSDDDAAKGLLVANRQEAVERMHSVLDDPTVSASVLNYTTTEKTPAYISKLKRDIANDYINSWHSLHTGSTAEIDQFQTKTQQQQDPDAASRSSAMRKCISCTSKIVDLTLLKEPIFYIICIANVFVFLGVVLPLKFQVDRAMTFELADTQEKTQEMANFLVSVSGMASTVGRGSSALLGVRRDTNKLLFHNISVLLAGVVCFFNVFCTTYPLMVTFSVIFTFNFGVYVALSSVVVCDMLGPEAVNNAFALMCMLRGFANIAGGPIAGAAYDITQNYDICFYIGGAMIAMGALCFFMLMLPQIQKRSFHKQVKEMDIGVDVNEIAMSMTNINAPTDRNKKLYISSNGSLGSVVNSRLRVDNV